MKNWLMTRAWNTLNKHSRTVLCRDRNDRIQCLQVVKYAFKKVLNAYSFSSELMIKLLQDYKSNRGKKKIWTKL